VSSAVSVTPVDNDKPLLATKYRGLLLMGVMMVSMMQFIDATIATVALPHMKSALGASNDTISWVLTSFMIASALFTPITGWLSDRVGSRNLFLGATLIFLLSSAACGAATSLSGMVIFRTIQGIASAFMGPMTMTIMFDISAPKQQAMTMAVFGMIVMVAPIMGPFLGGILTEYLNWRWIYYVNLPIGIPAMALLWWLLPSRPKLRRKLDLFGFLAIATALGAFQLMIDRGQHQDWFSSWEIVIEGLISLSALWLFIVHSWYSKEPLFNRALFRDTNFVASMAFMSVLGFSVIGLSSVLPMMFQNIYGYPVIDTGLLTAPRGIGVMATSFLAGMLIKRIDYRFVITTGYLISAGGMYYMTSWALDMGSFPILMAAFIQGMGFGLIVSPMNYMAFSTLNPALRPDGSSLMGLFRNLGGSIGISVIVTMLARNQQESHADVASHITAGVMPGIDLPAIIDRLPGIGGGIMMAINGEVTRQAMMIAFLDNFYLLFWMMLAFAPLPLLLKKPSRRTEAPPMIID
jgi:DHA2 family multidrug resistance protein